MIQDSQGGPAGQGMPSGKASAGEYLRMARACLRSGQGHRAYEVLRQAADRYPTHPVILSYVGWLRASVQKEHRSGLATCRKAFLHFKTPDQDVAAAVYPLLYLNLGRVFLLSGRKKEAVESFGKGLRYDRGHIELRREMRSLGVRKEPPLSFLSRSNPLNKYIGILLHPKSGES